MQLPPHLWIIFLDGEAAMGLDKCNIALLELAAVAHLMAKK